MCSISGLMCRVDARHLCAYSMRMKNVHSSPAKTRPVNVTLPADAVAEAKAYGLNVSEISRHALMAALREERRRRYIEENKEAIAEYNAWIEQHGMLITPMWMRDDVAF